jgi:hypothetical protein
MHPPLLPFLVFFLGAGTLLVCQQLFFQYLYDVKLGAAAVEIVIFRRFVILSIPYDEVAACERISVGKAIFSFSLGLVNRPFTGYVLLHRKRGFFLRRFLVTPNRPDEFCAEVIARARRQLTEV